jgi:hypothetical protein
MQVSLVAAHAGTRSSADAVPEDKRLIFNN